MKEISDLLKQNDLRALSYKREGNVIVADTNMGKVVLKKNRNKDYIFEYLDNRNFNYYPEIISSKEYIISKYIEGSNIPNEQKIMDLIDLVALMHNKTTHYKNVSIDEYKKIYEDLSNNFEYLYEYYNDLITIIDGKEYMSPSEYLLARNISYIFESIDIGKTYIEDWLKDIEGLNKMRVAVVHNNLNLSHFIRGDRGYLLSWDKSKIDIPIFDLYNLYNNHFDDFDFYELLKKYEKLYPLKEYELKLLFILMIMPFKIEFNLNEFDMCKRISSEIARLNKSRELIMQYKKSIKK